MFNAAIRQWRTPLAIFTSLTLFASCSGSADKDKAQALLDSATQAFDSGNYTLALSLTDSLKRSYPSQIEIRRKALHLTTRATEGLMLHRLETADSLLATLGVKGDSLQKLIRYVKNPIEGYYVGINAKDGGIVGSNGIQARLTPNGDFYLISSLKSKAVKSTSVTVACDGASASTSTVAYDGERNDRSMGAEVITYMGAECDSLGHFIQLHYSQPMTLTFNGSTSYSMPLPQAQAQEIATLYEYSTTMRRAKVASLEKEKLTRALDIARAQAAKTYVEPSDDEK